MKNQNHKNIRIAITTGDPDGIGCEVALKALARLGPQPDVQFLLWRSIIGAKNLTEPLQEKFSLLPTKDFAELWCLPHDPRNLIDVISDQPPTSWVLTAAQACMNDLCDALVTGPLSKTGQKAAGYGPVGHTELLAQVSHTKNLHMGFVGDQFGVVLVTGHVPLDKVKNHLTTQRLTSAIAQAFDLRRLLAKEKQNLPVALVGLNPHAGEKGLIGREEISTMLPVLKKFQRRHLNVVGPLVPDAAFLQPMRNQYSVFVCPYHDQGLIPFKLVHGFNQGVHITMGLPFVRTSVDHGTAKDIFGKNQAHEGSMFEAICAAINLVQYKRGPL